MTREEFIAKYGEAKVKLTHYHKYTFYFGGEVDGVPISVGIGGEADEIYRMEVIAMKWETVASLDPHVGKCGSDEFFDI